MVDVKPEDILYLFIRPKELLIIPKGKDKVAFHLPKEYLPDRYLSIANEVTKRFSLDKKREIIIEPIDFSDLHCDTMLGPDDQFSVFIHEHLKMAGHLIGIFIEKKTFSEFLSAAAYCRNRICSQLFIYALSVAVLHRSDTKHLKLPGLCSVFPQLFINAVALKKVREEVYMVPENSRKPIVIEVDHTATNLDIEHRVSYFREDLGVNLHHDHWHKIYPGYVDIKHDVIVKKDRRGELFYYMHQQMVARYNFERLCNQLLRVKSFNDWREPIPEGYFPKLGVDMFPNYYPGRPSGATLKDIDRLGRRIQLRDLERVTDRILGAIHQRFVIGSDEERVDLDEIHGIDTLGNVVESTILSPSQSYYGSVHNDGHMAISACHDPDHRHLENWGVMSDNITAMRDPIFYRWHTFIDNIFQEHKNLLTPYRKDELDYTGIQVNDVRIMDAEDSPTDSFYTHWQQSSVDVSNGLNYQPSGSVFVTFTHLNYEPFSYEINITNSTARDRMGTVRIFMAPRYDERGYPIRLNEQRKLMIELDKFTVTLKPGTNTVPRRSDESSLTIPFEEIFPKLGGNEMTPEISLRQENYCGCGWPQYMLIPKGTEAGFPVDLFVMVSNYCDDKVDQGPGRSKNGLGRCKNGLGRCKDAASFCGLKDKKYPDARAMGYPFDRPLHPEVTKFQEFKENNMFLKEMNISFTADEPKVDGSDE